MTAAVAGTSRKKRPANRERLTERGLRAVHAGELGVERAVRVTRAAMWWMKEKRPSSKERREELRRALSAHKAWVMRSIEALAGKTLERVNPRTGEGERLEVDQQIVRTWRDIASSLLWQLSLRTLAMGELQPLSEITRAKTSRTSRVSARTFTTWMPWLEVAGVLLYHHGRSRHPGVVGFPELYRTHVEECRHVVGMHMTAAQLSDENRWWWAPMCRALLESERASRKDESAGDARGELAAAIVEVEAARLEHERHKTEGVNKRRNEKKQAEHDRDRERVLRERAERDLRMSEEQRAQLEEDRKQAHIALERARAREKAKAERRRQTTELVVELDQMQRDADLARITALAARAHSHAPAPPSHSAAAAPVTALDPGSLNGSNCSDGGCAAVPVEKRPPAAPAKDSLAPDGAPNLVPAERLAQQRARRTDASIRETFSRLGQAAGFVVVDDGPGKAGQAASGPPLRVSLVPVRSPTVRRGAR